MDWRHVIFALEQGTSALIGLAVTIPIFAISANTKRSLVASSASLACVVGFLISCLVAGVPGIEASQLAEFVPLAALVVTALLVAPSVLALRWRWLGILHLVTLAAAVFLWLIGTLAITHDAT